ncbi:MAG: hypothetical protein PHP82_02835 [Candidatus ainarchaeum sp.]|nr:hypothetical protein [Candidatus ainarchaeum sp.]
MSTAYLRGRKAGLRKSVHESNSSYQKANQRKNNLAVPGGQMGYADPKLVQKYLKAIAKRDKVKQRE